jgi:hypothetical protein
MKCEVCLSSLEEYFDGELLSPEADEIASHLVTCSVCSDELNSLRATEGLLAQYDREIEISPMLWHRVSERTLEKSATRERLNFLAPIRAFFATPTFSLATAGVLILIAVTLGALYLKSTNKQRVEKEIAATSTPSHNSQSINKDIKETKPIATERVTPGRQRSVVAQRTRQTRHSVIDRSDVLSADFGYVDLEDQDTAKHLEQTQNLLRSIRNVRVGEFDEEIDVTYDKALSRRLLNENIVLRRDAEMQAKFPTKTLLSDLEPILIDIANLPDQAKPEDVRLIKERVQKTEIVAELLSAGLR